MSTATATPTGLRTTSGPPRVGYVLKMYPRFSETFIVNEILAHEAAGLDLEIFSLRPPADGRFHAELARVRAPVTYIDHGGLKPTRVWDALRSATHGPGELNGEFSQLVELSVDDAVQAIQLAAEVVERRVTHLHAHFGSVATTVARMAARIAGVSFSFTAHAKDIFHESVDPDDLRRKGRDAAAVVTVSEFNRDYLVEQIGLPEDRVHRIYNGIDLARFPFSDDPPAAPRIVAVGRLVEKKGFGDLIAAADALVRMGTEFECLIIGAGPLEAELRNQIERRELNGVVRLLGPRPQHQVAAAVRDATLMAAPCVVGTDANRDGLPTVILEAMALGTACVATDVTGIPEAIIDGHTGMIVPERSPVDLATAIARLLSDGRLRTALARRARAKVERDFDVEAQAARLREVFSAVSTHAL